MLWLDFSLGRGCREILQGCLLLGTHPGLDSILSYDCDASNSNRAIPLRCIGQYLLDCSHILILLLRASHMSHFTIVLEMHVFTRATGFNTHRNMHVHGCTHCLLILGGIPLLQEVWECLQSSVQHKPIYAQPDRWTMPSHAYS